MDFYFPNLPYVDPPVCYCENEICSAYEAWCSQADSINWYNRLNQRERHSLAREAAAYALLSNRSPFFAVYAPPEPF